jgi:hypothetical protein
VPGLEGVALFIGGVARLACYHGARRMMGAREACSPPRGNLIRHATPLSNPPRFLCTYCFLTQFSREILEVFWCSKRVMQHIFRNFVTSTFQRYKVCANQSSDERDMAPGSWGVGAFFRVFLAKIPAKRGKPPANRELHTIAGVSIFLTHPGSRINSWRAGKTQRAKAVVREEKHVRFSARFSYFLSVFARMFD